MELLSIFGKDLPVIDKEQLRHPQILALLIRDLQGNILLVKENHCEHGKKWNIVTETFENEDQDLQHTAQAAILEEISSSIRNFWLAKDSYRQTPENPEYNLHSAVMIYTGNSKTDFSPIDPTEIIGYQWVSFAALEDLHYQELVESEVLPFVTNYQALGFLEPFI